ncbi:MAG: pyridoxal 5'-phosphate synthase, glutaminase subunit Pdx2 [Candidatus Kentron sp. G]|nr:MAG: pyridoxal 5'-phosphate synthase, glutaminase subunit Pdx2 [Candidatus Kentron sp. G]VFN06102.1 MAG: pyridoxal 5'-phosphate synthase, glutaminase subunit Pdx2 [Candidatus Kentron sp. G]VFN07892.1 MAG: pyridoxal 5'-phosphate synthase, glutaminase subunit Pdx2 [Candidatus Kentron sp. G]
MTHIGIIDLQGGVVEHLEHLERLGVPAVRVKEAADMQTLAGLIIPGGESSCLGRLLRLYGLDRAIRERFAAGLKLWGTCAGAILVAKQVDGEPAHLGLMDIDIQRNAFGSQLDSFHTKAEIPGVADHRLPLTFIRAPKISRVGEGVRCLLHLQGHTRAGSQDNGEPFDGNSRSMGPGPAPDEAARAHPPGSLAPPSTTGGNRPMNQRGIIEGTCGARHYYCAAAEDTQTLVTIFHPELTPDPAFHRYFCRKCGLSTRATPEVDWQRDSWTRFTPIP